VFLPFPDLLSVFFVSAVFPFYCRMILCFVFLLSFGASLMLIFRIGLKRNLKRK